MSRRITTQTEFRNHDIVTATLTRLGYHHKSNGTRVQINSGSLAGASIDTTNGAMSIDEDLHRPEAVDAIKQSYAELCQLDLIQKNGGQVTERTVDQQGNIILMYQIG